MITFFCFPLKRLSVLLLAALALGAAPLPSYAAGDKPAKASKGKKKAKRKGKKGKKAKKVANAAKKAGQEKKIAGGDVLIADAKTPFDKLFNQAIQWVQEGTYGPDDIRVNGKSLFEYAASRGLLVAMKLLVEAGSEVKVIESCAPAIASGRVECIKYMQELGIPLCSPRERDSKQWTMEQAILSGNIEFASYVYEQLRPYDKASIIINPHSIRYASLRSGNVEMVKYWQEKGIEPKRDDVLHAAVSGKLEMLQLLGDKVDAIGYSREAKINEPGGINYTMLAARSGNLEMLKFFVEKGAPVQPSDNEKKAFAIANNDYPESPMLYAALSGNLDSVKYLEGKGATADAGYQFGVLEAAVASGNLELVKHLAPKEQTKQRVSNALCLASHLAYADIVKYLVEECAADVNAGGFARTTGNKRYMSMTGLDELPLINTGGTPLSFAAAAGDLSLVKYLIDKGANVDAIKEGNTEVWDTSALIGAASGQPHVLKFLLTKASLASDEVRNQLFVIASKSSSLACLKLIFENKVDVNAKIVEDEEVAFTAIQQSCGSIMPGRGACFKFLLDKGAKPISEDIITAVFARNYDCLPLIYAQNVKSPKVNNRTQPILQRAAEAGRADAVRLMVEHGLPIDSGKDGHSGDGLRSTVLAASNYMLPGHLECIRYFTSKGLRLDKDELDKLVAGEVLFDDYYAPEPLRKVLQETCK